MKTSKFLSLDLSDILKGLLMTLITKVKVGKYYLSTEVGWNLGLE